MAYFPKNMEENNTYTGSLALQDIKGVINMVFSLSLRFSSVREAIMAGTEQPNPKSNGRNAFPESPTRLIRSSMTNAALAIYPLSSRYPRARKRIKMLGRKVRIPPTPEMIPSTISDCSMGLTFHVSNRNPVSLETSSNAVSKYPFSHPPTAKVRKNTIAMIPRKIGSPSHFPVRYLSIRSVRSGCPCSASSPVFGAAALSFSLPFTTCSMISSITG